MKLILARHGNTFGPGDTPVWVGAKEDLSLVEKGLDQAREMAAALERNNLNPTRIIAGPLKRTRQGAALIAEITGFQGEIEIDERLTEIDYGSWGGKSDAEIAETYGQTAIDDWRDHSVRPARADWSPDEATLRQNAISVLNEIREQAGEQDVVLVLTSNGILRFYHQSLYERDQTPPPGKVKTGHLCLADRTDDGFQPLGWNLAPGEL